MSCRVQRIAWCSVPKASTTWRWYALSSNSGESKVIENVRNGALVHCCTRAAFTVESRPPLRYAPTGTSLRSRSRVASVSSSSSSSAQSCSGRHRSSTSYRNCQ